MFIEDIEIGDRLLYIPKHLLWKGKRVVHENLGVVTRKNGSLVFVRYLGMIHSVATHCTNLYSIKHREDLHEIMDKAEKIGG